MHKLGAFLVAIAALCALPSISFAAPPNAPDKVASASEAKRATAALTGTYLFLGICDGDAWKVAHVEGLPSCTSVLSARVFEVKLSEGMCLRAAPKVNGEQRDTRIPGTVLTIERAVLTSEGDGPRYLWGKVIAGPGEQACVERSNAGEVAPHLLCHRARPRGAC
jgi:hypothetical protein